MNYNQPYDKHGLDMLWNSYMCQVRTNAVLAEWIVYDELDVYYFQRINILNTKLDKTCHYDPHKCTIFY